MKDESKAGWPEGMKIENSEEVNLGNVIQYWQSTICESGTPNIEVEVNGSTQEEAQARARQIIALPKMVALLHYLADIQEHYSVGDWERVCALLKEIGELE